MTIILNFCLKKRFVEPCKIKSYLASGAHAIDIRFKKIHLQSVLVIRYKHKHLFI